jgi:hypothetical protein
VVGNTIANINVLPEVETVKAKDRTEPWGNPNPKARTRLTRLKPTNLRMQT